MKVGSLERKAHTIASMEPLGKENDDRNDENTTAEKAADIFGNDSANKRQTQEERVPARPVQIDSHHCPTPDGFLKKASRKKKLSCYPQRIHVSVA